MIVIQSLEWDNCFSYAKNNRIDFTENPLTQLVGKNGHGKSSIALILELGLYNKNSKGTKAAKILNRYVEDNFYRIIVTFSKGTDIFKVTVKRASTQSVKLTLNGEDISAHTATATFKMIEDIIGLDHKEFSQKIYQSSAQSLEFLTATDTVRKKFLIDLLNLDKYSVAFELFKGLTKSAQEEVTKVEVSLNTISVWINKYSSFDPSFITFGVVPEQPVDLITEKSQVAEQLKTIDKTNAAIKTNLSYKKELDSINLDLLPIEKPYSDDTFYVKELTEAQKESRDATAFINKVKSLKDTCPTCSQHIDNSKHISLMEETVVLKTLADARIEKMQKELFEIQENNKIIAQNDKKRSRWEQYNSLFNRDEKTEILAKTELEDKVVALTSEIEKRTKQIAEITRANTRASEHNSRVVTITKQLAEFNAELVANTNLLDVVSNKLNRRQILSKVFSTNGLVAFKIEGMVKDLEALVNQYLAELADGRFQLGFVIAGEKLNVVITDNGDDVEMTDLSSGEKARINTATLLAIRKLMQQLSSTKLNLLILDETIDNLDLEGKEKLVEVLLKETHLNTFIISHGFQHPLIEKMEIIKEDNISRIET